MTIKNDKNTVTLKIVCDDDLYLPRYANDTDACMDVKVRIDNGIDTIKSGETKVYGTGIKVAVPKDYVLIMHPRSSTGIKLHLMLSNTTGIIDAGYRDEIRLAVTNFGNENITISNGQRLAQFMLIPRPKVVLERVEDNEDFRTGDRGGGVGSTGC